MDFFKRSLLNHFSKYNNDKEYISQLESISEGIDSITSFLYRFKKNVYESAHYSSLIKDIIKLNGIVEDNKENIDNYTKFSASIYDYLQKSDYFSLKTPIFKEKNSKITYKFSNSINEKIINNLKDLKYKISILILVAPIKEDKKVNPLDPNLFSVGEQAKFIASTKLLSERHKKSIITIKDNINNITNTIKESV